MKQIEFMHAASEVFLDFFEELYQEKQYVHQYVVLKKQQGSFKIRDYGGVLTFYVDKNGTISYKCSSVQFSRERTGEYYVYDEKDNHGDILSKLKSDLRKLKKELFSILLNAGLGNEPLENIVFESQKEFTANVSGKN